VPPACTEIRRQKTTSEPLFPAGLHSELREASQPKEELNVAKVISCIFSTATNPE
jgi:hypothetical protein